MKVLTFSESQHFGTEPPPNFFGSKIYNHHRQQARIPTIKPNDDKMIAVGIKNSPCDPEWIAELSGLKLLFDYLNQKEEAEKQGLSPARLEHGVDTLHIGFADKLDGHSTVRFFPFTSDCEAILASVGPLFFSMGNEKRVPVKNVRLCLCPVRGPHLHIDV